MTRLRRNIPNALTLVRLTLGLLFFFLPYEYQLAAVFIAATSDVLDGVLARRWDIHSEFGRIMDPVADRVFVAAMAVTFLIDARLTLLQLLLVSLRDLVVVLGATAIFIAGRRSEFTRIEARGPGKLATVIQFLFLGSTLVIGEALWSLVAVTAVVSAVAAVDYTRSYFRYARVTIERPREV